MDELAKEERRIYQREWRKKNQDKVQAINKRYWANRAKKRIATQAKEEGGKTE